MARLVITEGKKKGDFHMLTPNGLTIGRLATNDLTLPDEQVSRQHARIESREDGFYVMDLGSMNSTKVNGENITECLLVTGDVVKVGMHEMRFEDETTAKIQMAEGMPIVAGGGTIVKSLDDINEAIEKKKTGDAAALEKSNTTLRRLFEVGKALLNAPDLDALLNLIIDQVFKTLPAQRGFLMLLDKDTGSLDARVIRTNEPGFEGDITISRTITDTVIRDRVSVLTKDAATDPRFRAGESVVLYGIRSALCVPLWSDDDIIGVIFVDTKSETHTFTEDDLDLLTAMANQAAIGIKNAQLAERAKRESELRNRLARYHSPDVIEHIMKEGGDAGLDHVTEVTATVLFSDIKGFTGLSEQLTPSEVATLLNEYFTAMTDVLFEYGGTLDKYIGDAIMALFGAPFSREDDAVRAVRAGLKMQKFLKEIRGQDTRLSRLDIRIGINTGVVVAGNIGSPRRMDYTVIGDAVNVAQRLESIAKPGQVLIGGSTYNLVKDHFMLNEIGRQRVKGKDMEVAVYEVLG
jgi:adenylate cyclase